MPSDNPEDGDRVARHCSAKDFRNTEKTVLAGDAFKPDDADQCISVNWLECHDGNDRDRILAICKDIATRRMLRANHCLSIVQVGRIKAIGAELGEDLRVTHEPDGPNISHAGIWGIPLDQRTLQEELAAEASKDIRPVVLPG